MQSKNVKQIGVTDLKKEPPLERRKLRVVAYCRVSNHTEEQLASLNRQIQYYTSLIAQNSNWTLKNKFDPQKYYGKRIFSEYILNHFEQIDFGGFRPLLDTLDMLVRQQ